MTLSVESRIRVFIGTEPRTEIARKVLECSIQRRTDVPVEFVPMIGPGWEYSTKGFHFGTGFSLRRWMIPAYCKWAGRAIYLDADQLCLTDIRTLWRSPEIWATPVGTSTWCTYQPDIFSKTPVPQSSVMLIDCAAAKEEWGWDIDKAVEFLRKDPNRNTYAGFMHMWDSKSGNWWTKLPPRKIPAEWNALDTYDKAKTRIIHYTSVPNQPWYNPLHPNAEIWQKELIYALSFEAVTDKELLAAVDAWNPHGERKTGFHPDYRKFINANRLKGRELGFFWKSDLRKKARTDAQAAAQIPKP